MSKLAILLTFDVSQLRVPVATATIPQMVRMLHAPLLGRDVPLNVSCLALAYYNHEYKGSQEGIHGEQ